MQHNFILCIQKISKHWICNQTRTTLSCSMTFAIAFCVFFFTALALARPGDDHYSDKYDDINLDEILNNDKILENYVNCLLDKGKCTPDAKELRDHMKEAMENDCGKCTDAQKKGADHVMKHLINHKQGYWNELTAKFDPEKKYVIKHEERLRDAK